MDCIGTRDVVDCDGKPIRVGSVITKADPKDDTTGVVVRIVREEQMGKVFDSIGDMHIELKPGYARVSNDYASWKHVPHDEQTLAQRFHSWTVRPFDYDEDLGIPREEALAIDGIMTLLPSAIVNWEDGPWPDTLEDALYLLRRHLERLENKE